jgi:hypothetical protein
MLSLFGLIGLCTVPSLAQQEAAEPGYRKLAPDVVTEIQPVLEEEETFSGPREIVELVRGHPELAWSPNYAPGSNTLLEMAKQTIFRRQIWALELGFKPLRMITVQLPAPGGATVTRQVWYLVYYVKNNGRHLNPVPKEGTEGRVTHTTEQVNHSIRFFPTFVLQCHDVGRVYLDEVIPVAVERIREREDPNRTFYNSVTISDVTIPVSDEYEDRSVWGIVTWVGVDPRSDFFSVFVSGLTNAYRWQDPPDGFQPGDPPGAGRRLTFKTLQLNFWRPGDAIDLSEREFRYGVPNEVQVPPAKGGDQIPKLYGQQERVDYRWVYQ